MPLMEAVPSTNDPEHYLQARQAEIRKRPSLQRRKAMRALALRIKDGLSDAEIAERMGVGRNTIGEYWRLLRSTDDWRKDAEERLDSAGLHQAVSNVLEGLDAKDQKYTLAVLEGRGILRDPKLLQPPATQQQVLAVKIEMPNGGQVTAAAGSIVGVPNGAQS